MFSHINTFYALIDESYSFFYLLLQDILSDNYCYAFVSYLLLTASIVIVLKYFLSIYVYRISILIIDFYCNNIILDIVTLYTRVGSRSKFALQLAPQSLTTLTCQPSRLRMCVYYYYWFKMNKILNFLVFTTICFFFLRFNFVTLFFFC